MNKPPQPITGPSSVPNPAPSPGLTQVRTPHVHLKTWLRSHGGGGAKTVPGQERGHLPQLAKANVSQKAHKLNCFILFCPVLLLETHQKCVLHCLVTLCVELYVLTLKKKAEASGFVERL